MKELITEWDKNDLRWSLCTYYEIAEKKEGKIIRITDGMSKEPMGKPYLSWVHITYGQNKMLLSKFVEWDNYYGLNILRNMADKYVTDLPPQECFDKANELLWGWSDGRIWLDILDITEETEPGFYVGR